MARPPAPATRVARSRVGQPPARLNEFATALLQDFKFRFVTKSVLALRPHRLPAAVPAALLVSAPGPGSANSVAGGLKFSNRRRDAAAQLAPAAPLACARAEHRRRVQVSAGVTGHDGTAFTTMTVTVDDREAAVPQPGSRAQAVANDARKTQRKCKCDTWFCGRRSSCRSETFASSAKVNPCWWFRI